MKSRTVRTVRQRERDNRMQSGRNMRRPEYGDDVYRAGRQRMSDDRGQSSGSRGGYQGVIDRRREALNRPRPSYERDAARRSRPPKRSALAELIIRMRRRPAEKAQYFANKTLRKVQKKVGFPERIR